MPYRKILRTRKLARTAFRELSSYIGATALYPLGIFEKQTTPCRHPRSAPNPRPIILVHGIVHNRSAFMSFEKKLIQLRWENVYTFNYHTMSGGVFQMVEDLSLRVDQILAATCSDQVDIIAHSLGGLVARTYMTLGAGRGKVSHLVTLGTPHQGTNLSFMARGLNLGTLAQDLRVGSYLIDTLKNTPLPRGSKITSIYSENDWTLVPTENGAVVGKPEVALKNYRLEESGHIGLLFSQEAFDKAVTVLAGKKTKLHRVPLKDRTLG